MVLTILKNISQWEGLSHILWNIKNVWNHQAVKNDPNHQPDLRYPFFISIRWRSWLGFNHPPTKASPASPQKIAERPLGEWFFWTKHAEKILVFTVFCDKSRCLRCSLKNLLNLLTGAKRREWMGCWGLLGWLLIVSQWIIPSFPTKHK